MWGVLPMIQVMTKLCSGLSHVFFEWELESEVMIGPCPHALIPNKVAQVMWDGISWAKWQRAEDRQKSSTNENYLPRQTVSVLWPARHPAAPSSPSARWILSRRVLGSYQCGLHVPRSVSPSATQTEVLVSWRLLAPVLSGLVGTSSPSRFWRGTSYSRFADTWLGGRWTIW